MDERRTTVVNDLEGNRALRKDYARASGHVVEDKACTALRDHASGDRAVDCIQQLGSMGIHVEHSPKVHTLRVVEVDAAVHVWSHGG